MKDFGRQLALLLTGAALTFVTATFVTREWQQHDNDVAARNAVACELGRSVGAFLGAVRVHGGVPARADELDEAFADWNAASLALAGQLGGYVPDSGLEKKWRNSRQTMNGVYAVLRSPRRSVRMGWLRRVNGYLVPGDRAEAEANYQNLNGLLEAPAGGPWVGSVYDNARRVLVFQLSRRSEQFVEDVLGAESIYD